MEEVAVFTPSTVNNDELSDESIILDLHVSDTEEGDESTIKKSELEDKTINGKISESEEDILNKYVADSPSSEDKKIEDDLLKDVEDEIDKVEVQINGENETKPMEDDEDLGEVPSLIEDDETQRESQSKENTENLHTDPDSTQDDCKGFPRIDKDVCSIENKKENEESESHKKKAVDVNSEQNPTAEKDFEKTEDADDGDLLQVMEEKSIEEAEQEKDENSCSSSDKDEESKASDETKQGEQSEENGTQSEENGTQSEESGTQSEENGTQIEPNVENDEQIVEKNGGQTEENEQIADDNNESQVDADETGECPMDIEENDIGIIFSEHNCSKESNDGSLDKTPSRRASIINNMEIGENEITNDKENDDLMNKENEKPDGGKGDKIFVIKDASNQVLTNGDVRMNETTQEEESRELSTPKHEDSSKKSNKRQLSKSDDEDSAKKIKLDCAEPKAPVEKRELVKLNNFKQFMLDKNLQKLTRYELEELCLQKMCECIVNKSELGELRQKVKVQEQAIETWRKEAIVVAKQTRDLKIVHERLVADLKAMKEQTGKLLVPVKITRSVGLQAYTDNTTRLRNQTVINGATPRTPPVASPVKNVTPTRQVKSKVMPQRPMNKPLQPVTQKDNVNNTQKRSVQTTKKNPEPKAVIDLTDEDERNHVTKPNATQSGTTTVRLISKPNNSNNVKASNAMTSTSPKIMIMTPTLARSGSAVMLKVNSNGVVSQPNGVTSIANGQIQNAVRTVQSRVSSVPTSTIRSAALSKPSFKHPAPLPLPPTSQLSIIARKPIPPKPHLNLTRSNCGTGIVLQWKMPYKLNVYENIVSYQLYAYQETKSPPTTNNWGKIGDVKALELPMAVTLTQFAVGNRYYFAVRAVDGLQRLGPFSEPQTILL